jgi:hypothetical protein
VSVTAGALAAAGLAGAGFVAPDRFDAAALTVRDGLAADRLTALVFFDARFATARLLDRN